MEQIGISSSSISCTLLPTPPQVLTAEEKSTSSVPYTLLATPPQLLTAEEKSTSSAPCALVTTPPQLLNAEEKHEEATNWCKQFEALPDNDNNDAYSNTGETNNKGGKKNEGNEILVIIVEHMLSTCYMLSDANLVCLMLHVV